MKIKYAKSFFKDLERLSSRKYKYWDDGILMIPRRTKWWFQRRIRGYDDQDLWNLYGHIGNHLIKVLKAFKKMDRMGVPMPFANLKDDDDDVKKGSKRWEKEIQDMIDGFDYLANERFEMKLWEEYLEKDSNTDNWIKEYIDINAKNYKQAQRKASKLIKYFGNLWD